MAELQARPDIRLPGLPDPSLTVEEGQIIFGLVDALPARPTSDRSRSQIICQQLCEALIGVLGADSAAAYLIEGDELVEAYKDDRQVLIWLGQRFSIPANYLSFLHKGQRSGASKYVPARELDVDYVWLPLVAYGRLVGALAFFASGHDLNEATVELEFAEKLLRVGAVYVADAVAREQVEQEALYDPKGTGLLAANAGAQRLAQELKRVARYDNAPLSVIFLDIDHFKSINDTYGHAVGDEVLNTVARLIMGAIRAEDSAVRMGGEEMLVILPLTPTNPDDPTTGSLQVAKRLHGTIRAHRFDKLTKHDRRVTASIGVSGVAPREFMGPEELVQRADDAMYQAKQNGRDQWLVWSPNTPRKGDAAAH